MWRGISNKKKKIQMEWGLYQKDGNLWANDLCIITKGLGIDLHNTM